MITALAGPRRPKETAYVPGEEQQAADETKHRDHSADELDSAMGECRMLRLLQRRLERFGAGLFPLTGSQLLLSQPAGMTAVLPDLASARHLLKQWEAQIG